MATGRPGELATDGTSTTHRLKIFHPYMLGGYPWAMSSEENTTPVPAPESWTNMKPKWQDLEQQMADHDPFDPDVMAEEPNY